ncbi:superfamily II DNA or RNA helicase [Alicyclobacillus sacchari]|uniref:DNA 3'-5' helicase n=1 Tax=Alicyclobacillus sacchari TaxID=392010 RepID=A0A4R8LT10_9BACL|nr:DEAD/DEAH box helicase [Alicyclobacillus sacchari]TDY50714.1 superfamily II DNA or RNA helicase [Alicyclobacillus sacchari]GMA55699.1 hypothetical protein GCM10025858_02020 [Alicyclobacillus sacchari]
MVVYPQADGRLYVSRSADPAGRLEVDVLPIAMDDFAQPIQVFDDVTVYQLSPLRLRELARSGRSAVEVLRYLRQIAQAPVPIQVQRTIIAEMAAGSVAAPALTAAMTASPGDVAIALRQDKQLRAYQQRAVEAFCSGPANGVIAMPCGAGKTVVGTAILAALRMPALILAPNEAACAQWKQHLLAWTTLSERDLDVHADEPNKPVAIATYARLVARDRRGQMRRLDSYRQRSFGLVIYDEVHALPARWFRLTAELAGTRKLGLSATLVREDGRAGDVLSLVGPVVFQMQARDLTEAGHLAPVRCFEVRVPLAGRERQDYERGSAADKHRIAAQNACKLEAVEQICARHRGERTLVMGYYTSPLHDLAKRLCAPIIDGRTPAAERLRLYGEFRAGRMPVLIVSRVANVAIDLPAATVAVQISGLFGSRQEEAQRLGRILRPNGKRAVFYSLVSDDTVEVKRAFHRQSYLVEQGYSYEILAIDELYKGGWSLCD